MSSTSGSRQRTLHLASCLSCAQDGETMGREADGKGCLARGSPACCESGHPQVSPARPAQNLCAALLCRRRRTGANPVSAGSRFDSDNRKISRLQTADSRCRQRQNRNRATRLSGGSVSALPTNRTQSALRLLPRLKGRNVELLLVCRQHIQNRRILCTLLAIP